MAIGSESLGQGSGRLPGICTAEDGGSSQLVQHNSATVPDSVATQQGGLTCLPAGLRQESRQGPAAPGQQPQLAAVPTERPRL